jgi:hypothetical protein
MRTLTKPTVLSLTMIILIGLVASGCTEPSEPTATFDGSTCTFAGPSDLDFNFNIPFVFVNESDSQAAMEVWKVPDGTTVEDVAIDGIVEIADVASDRRGTVDASAGESATISVLLDVHGDWLINCSTEDDYPAMIFQVFVDEVTGTHGG